MTISIQLIIAIAFCVNATLAVNFAFRFAFEKKPKHRTNSLVLCINIFSAIWSIGMGMMSIQTTVEGAYFWRIIGIFGTFIFLMAVQKTMCIISDINSKIQLVLNGISYSGIIVYLLYILPGQTGFIFDHFIGTTFYFTPGIINIIYSVYFTVVCINIAVVTFYMALHHQRKQIRATGKRFLIVEFFIFVGALFDMVLPTLGKPALPGSAITHFWGVFVFWFAIHKMYKSEVTITNMSEYIYYSLDTPVLVFDLKKHLIISNDSAIQFLNLDGAIGIDSEDAISRLFETDNSIFDFDNNNQVVTVHCTANDKNCEIAISKIYDDYQDVIGYILLLNDLTEHELVISRLEQAKLAADSANMSKSLFLANMSHEMRTPMNAILGFSEIALSEENSEQTKDYFRDIKRAGETLLSVINQVLDISKIELGQQELTCTNYNTARIFKDVEVIIGVQSRKKGLDFRTKIDGSFPSELFGDKDKIREILINILNNSVKYTNSGSIVFSVDYRMLEGDSAMIRFTVSDTGIGIRKEDIPSIFERFKRIDDNYNSAVEGTGLGLSITKGLIEMMEGSINVESTYGVGTTITIEIPQKVVDSSPVNLAGDQVETKLAAIGRGGHVDNKNIKILAVDDNAVNLKLVSALLKKYGIEHDTVSNGFDAIEMCKSNKYDIILLDQMMPGIDGVETMKRIRMLSGYGADEYKHIVALTANVVEGAEEELLTAGFNAYLAKPINIAAFEKVVLGK